MSGALDAVLHVTNGDVAAERLRELLPTATVLAWRDALHDGPVPAASSAAECAAIRGAFLHQELGSAAQNAERELGLRDAALEVAGGSGIALWFETDLYDQLQAWQIADRLASRDGPVWLATLRRGGGHLPIGSAAPTELRAAADLALLMDGRLRAEAQRLWSAFTASTPHGLVALLRDPSLGFPLAQMTVSRLLQELPAPSHGLARSEAALLEGARLDSRFAGVFRYQASQEEHPWLGDTWAARRLERLRDCGAVAAAGPVRSAPLRVTDLGRAMLRGETNCWRSGMPARWLGGIPLSPAWIWTWNAETGALGEEAPAPGLKG